MFRRFIDEYREAASLLEVAESELRGADALAPQLRWMAYDGAAAVGIANGRRRPDGRVFLNFGATPPTLIAGLADVAMAATGPVYTVAQSAERRQQLEDIGFTVELVDDEFEVRFETALRHLGRPRLPAHFTLVPPHQLDEAHLVALDNELRKEVPGTDGWVTTAQMWQAEIHSPEYDPSGYLVGVDRRSGAYGGLIRFWRNTDIPRLGLLAVTKPYRGSLLATGLLRTALEGASLWGNATFQTSTSPSNPVTYRALGHIGVAPIGRRFQMVRELQS